MKRGGQGTSNNASFTHLCYPTIQIARVFIEIRDRCIAEMYTIILISQNFLS